MRRKLITSALPYVNNVPHLGNLIQVLSADVYARFCRLRGYDTLYVCGTDEYGTATETRAAEEGVTPQALCDRYHELHADIYRWFGIAFDKFGRTSTPLQTAIVQDIFCKLDSAGFIVGRTIEQLHCSACGRFLADRYVRGVCPHCGYADARGDQCEACGKLLEPTELSEPRCSSCGQTPQVKPTDHLYIDLPAIKPKLETWLKAAYENGHWAHNAIQMTQAWIRDGLRERAITRDLKWGIPVPKPGYENKVFYVWFDAPIGYISITANLAAETGHDWQRFTDDWWKNPDEVDLFQFIGKDNIPFHTVIFPSSLLGTGEKWTMLHHMSSTEYLNYESGKFSKSKGIGVFGTDAIESGIPADVWRFYIFYNRPEKADAIFTWKDFQEKVNGELIGNLGNLVNRTLAFVDRYYEGKVPSGPSDARFWERMGAYEIAIAEKLERAELRDAFRTLFELSSFANKAFQDGEPWKLRQNDPIKAAGLIGDLCYSIRDICILMHPYLPATADRLALLLNIKVGPGGLVWNDLAGRQGLAAIRKPEVLFVKLEDDVIASLRDRYSGSQIERAEREKSTLKQEAMAVNDSAEFRFLKTVDLRSARIIAIERHPKADKLYVETLDIGGESRTIVSGLVPYYTEAELLGKTIIVAYNLKAAKLRGIESRGMLLAASLKNADGSELVEVLTADAPSGTKIELAWIPNDANSVYATSEALPEIEIGGFFAVPIQVKDGTVMVGTTPLTVQGKTIRTIKVLNGEVG